MVMLGGRKLASWKMDRVLRKRVRVTRMILRI